MGNAVNGSTRLTGVFGCPVGHSLSPAMHNAAFEALGLNWLYAAFEVAPDNLETALKALHAFGIVGVNLTIPHKEQAVKFMDTLTPEALQAGAVNTVHCLEGALIGDNTDGEGFYRPLAERGFTARGRKTLLLGAGGAARSAAFRLAAEGAKITISNRTPERALSLAEAVKTAYPEAEPEVVLLEEKALIRAAQAADLLVNTTRVGMYPQQNAPSPMPEEGLHPSLLVYDLVYNPCRTVLLQQAAHKGCTTLEGVKMLVYQGAAAFERWTGERPPVEIMENAVRKGLGLC